jgi:hypothetical protein
MLAYRTPGVYFERPQARPAIRRLPTDVAGFVGIARSGPLHHPVRVTSWPEFVAVFGGHTVQGYLAYAVEGFFANGGRTCWVVRVADPAAARAAGLDLAGAGGAPVGRLTAASPGTWARELTVTAVGTAPGRFTLIVRGAGGVRELWRELDLDPAGERWIGAVLNDRDTGSRLLRVCPAAAPAMGESALRVIEGRLGVARPSGGADGLATLTADHLAAAGSVFPFDDPCAGQARTGEPWGLAALERIDEVSVVAMPDAVPRLRVEVVTRERPRRCDVLPADDGEPAPPPAAHLPDEEPPDRTPDRSAADVARLQRELIAHCERLRDRVALLDVPPAAAGGGDVPEQVLLWRRDFTSRWAAAYWPWLVGPEPLPTGELLTRLPPSGHVAGIIARSDLRAGVHKPPANERLEGVEDVAFALDDPAHGDLNEAGIDAVRPYPGRGIRVAGARTLDREPAQRYLNVRRLLIFIAESIEEQVQWTVFEPHNRRLRQQVDRVVRAFLLGLWRDGMLDGAKESEAFHVACDETTNPPEEVETGRLICEIGVLPPWPAEFVVARIGISEGGVELIEDQAPGEGGRG